MRIGRGVAAGVVLCITAGMAPAQDASERVAADSMQSKLTAIIVRADLAAVAPTDQVQRTAFTDREVNAYFKVHGPEFLPTGVAEPRVVLDGAGRVRAQAVVDLDEALKPRERSWLDPLAWVGGKVQVTGAGVLHAANGRGVLRVETATLNGVAIPKAVLQEIVAYYSRTPDNPRGFQLDEPFELPSAIRAVEMAPGRAVVVQ